MNWLARLKKLDSTPAAPLQNLQIPPFVGFVGACPEPVQKTESENEISTARLALFTERGLSMADAQAMAEKLAQRDLEQDERRLCLECLHLSGGMDRRWCGQWQKIGIGSAAIPSDLVTVLQRCKTFNERLEVSK